LTIGDKWKFTEIVTAPWHLKLAAMPLQHLHTRWGPLWIGREALPEWDMKTWDMDGNSEGEKLEAGDIVIGKENKKKPC
jgi:hypothetical protein